jgi:hypothetical protein
MGSFVRLPGSMAAIVLAGAALAAAAAPATAQAQAKLPCSTDALVTAIDTANSSGPARIDLRPYCTYDITAPAAATDGLPVITGDITLVGGPNTVIERSASASDPFRILDVAAGGTLSVTGISIQNGSVSGLGGGIQNAGTLKLKHVTLSGNHASNGGALANLTGATARVLNALIATNTTTSIATGNQDVTLNRSIVRNNDPDNCFPLNTIPGCVN